jgi:SAM-dependent methyltransferase
MTMDTRAYNQRAWDSLAERGNRWTVPVAPEVIARARRGDFEIVLTPTKPVPAEWFPPLDGCDVLGLASAGGQQAPVLAAAGARVTVLDNSPAQLDRDRLVAEREGLTLRLVQGDMAAMTPLADASFDLVFNPCSNCFVEDVRAVWRECARVLRPGGVLMSGFVNPLRYIFDEPGLQRGEMTVRHRIPHADSRDLTPEELDVYVSANEPVEFGHSLDDQLGGQLAAGFVLDGFFEDRYTEGDALSEHIATFIATRAHKG